MQAALGFGVHQLDLKACGQGARPLRPEEFEEVRDVVLKSIRPNLPRRIRVDRLRVDEHPILIALHRAFEDVAHTEFFADRLGVEVLALEGEGGVAGNDETVVEAREFGGGSP